MDRWEFVKQMMKQNPNLNVIILGDAMDRGSYGVEMLLQIKELSDVGRVRYVPGNHDEFAYDFLRGKILFEHFEQLYLLLQLLFFHLLFAFLQNQ